MFAKCSQCKYVFQADFQEKLLCPVCGSDAVDVEPSPESSSPKETSPRCSVHPQNPATGVCSRCGSFACNECSQPGPSGEPICNACRTRTGTDLEVEPTPWEQRASLGYVQALIKTIQLSSFHPSAFFSKMRLDNTDGALSYYWINTVAAMFFGILWQYALAALGMISQSKFSFTYLILAVAIIILAPLLLYINALLIHLGTIICKCSPNGFNATLRSVAYASSPVWLNIVPLCGWMIGWLWSFVLIVIGIQKTQRTTGGRAFFAVLLPPIILACCITGPLIFFVGVFGARGR